MLHFNLLKIVKITFHSVTSLKTLQKLSFQQKVYNSTTY